MRMKPWTRRLHAWSRRAGTREVLWTLKRHLGGTDNAFPNIAAPVAEDPLFSCPRQGPIAPDHFVPELPGFPAGIPSRKQYAPRPAPVLDPTQPRAVGCGGARPAPFCRSAVRGTLLVPRFRRPFLGFRLSRSKDKDEL